jgi:two-component system chemotaxis response regulator CheY
MPAALAINALIVDDQLTMRALIRSTLQQMGVMNVRDAGDGEEALDVAERPANLIITTTCSSWMVSASAGGARQLGSQRAAFIMLTGRADKDLVQRAAQFGANNYLVEPFTLVSLKEKIEQVFGAVYMTAAVLQHQGKRVHVGQGENHVSGDPDLMLSTTSGCVSRRVCATSASASAE